MTQRYLTFTRETAAALAGRDIAGDVVMLNLLRFRDVADYSASPELRPDRTVSGREAYRQYMILTAPLLEKRGGKLEFMGKGGQFLIGPPEAHWDTVLLVRHASVAAFMEFATDKAYLAVTGHRTAALLDSRLLPIEQSSGAD